MLWMYNKDGGKLFDSLDDVPKGYQDTPVEEAAPAEVKKDDELEALKALADEKGIKYHHKAGVTKLKELLEE